VALLVIAAFLSESPIPPDNNLEKHDASSDFHSAPVQSVSDAKARTGVHHDLGGGYTLHHDPLVTGDTVAWYLEHQGTPTIVGHGEIGVNSHAHVAIEHSFIHPDHQGKGVYPRILRHFNQMHAIVSYDLSRGAKRAWYAAFADKIHVHNTEKKIAVAAIKGPGSRLSSAQWHKATPEELQHMAAKTVTKV
jgi:GNAT superfamily N-acetyltransferase